MLAATTADVAALNSAAQAALAATGHVITSQGAVALADQHNGHVGDVIVTRQNNSRLRVDGGRRNGNAIANGDLGRKITVEVQGEILQIASQPEPGARTFSVDKDSGEIEGERYTALPKSYVIQRVGTELGWESAPPGSRTSTTPGASRNMWRAPMRRR